MRIISNFPIHIPEKPCTIIFIASPMKEGKITVIQDVLQLSVIVIINVYPRPVARRVHNPDVYEQAPPRRWRFSND
jgi:hypothetical protein